MSAIIAGAATFAVSAATAVVAATMPETQALLTPITEAGNEYVVVAASVLASIPALAIMSALAISGRD